MSKKYKVWIFWALMLIGALLVVSQSSYSDGDDAFFYQYTNSMGFGEYLSWRYQTWVGRMSGEAFVYLAFRLGLGFWRVVNAVMLVLLPMGVLRLSEKAAGIGVHSEEAIGPCAAAVGGYFLMNIMTVGYAAVWVNGSIFYTWCFTCGIWALMPFADAVFAKPGEEPALNKKYFLISIPCAVAGTMSIEQMSAVLLTFEVLAVVALFLRHKKVHPLLLVQTLTTAVAFVILFSAPGNEIRVASEIANWMPEYETMPFGQHVFSTIHWLLSSFANENKLFLCGIWVVGILLLLQQEQKKKRDWIALGIAAVFTLAALLPYAGFDLLSDMGMQYINIEACVYQVPSMAVMTREVILAMIWWAAALLFTLPFLWRVSKKHITLMLAYLAGIASEAIMYCSPTMYASGARVYYLTDLLYLFIILTLAFSLKKKRWRNGFYVGLLVAGVWNLVWQVLF